MDIEFEQIIGYAFYQKMGVVTTHSLELLELKNYIKNIYKSFKSYNIDTNLNFSGETINKFLNDYSKYITYNKLKKLFELKERVTRADLPYIFHLNTLYKFNDIFKNIDTTIKVFLPSAKIDNETRKDVAHSLKHKR